MSIEKALKFFTWEIYQTEKFKKIDLKDKKLFIVKNKEIDLLFNLTKLYFLINNN